MAVIDAQRDLRLEAVTAEWAKCERLRPDTHTHTQIVIPGTALEFCFILHNLFFHTSETIVGITLICLLVNFLLTFPFSADISVLIILYSNPTFVLLQPAFCFCSFWSFF